MTTFPTLIKDGEEPRSAETLNEFHQLRYDGWRLKDPDAEIRGEIPTPARADEQTAAPAATSAAVSVAKDSSDGPPPLGGAGSGIDAWRAYAETVGVDTERLDTREQIVDAIHDAGHPTERAE